MNKRHLISLTVALTLLPLAGYTVPRIAATINPVYFLVSSVAQGITEPMLPTTGASCAHDCVLRPSDVAKLSSADIVFYIDDKLEPFVRKLGGTGNKRLVQLSDGIELLEERSSRKREKDLHIWLDPDNAIKMIQKIYATLSAEDPENAATYRKNADAAQSKVRNMVHRINDILATVKDTPYITVHDAYQYFDRYFGLNFVASMSVGHAVGIRAKELAFAKKAAKEHKVKCIFTGPLYDSARYRLVGKKIKVYALDPLGSNISHQSEDGYLQLMETIAHGFRDCLQADE
ncbi:MAG: zinc ABC transporter substrate-binding protein [Anaplasma sp.]